MIIFALPLLPPGRNSDPGSNCTRLLVDHPGIPDVHYRLFHKTRDPQETQPYISVKIRKSGVVILDTVWNPPFLE